MTAMTAELGIGPTNGPYGLESGRGFGARADVAASLAGLVEEVWG